MNLIFKTPPSCPAAHYDDDIFTKGRGRKAAILTRMMTSTHGR